MLLRSSFTIMCLNPIDTLDALQKKYFKMLCVSSLKLYAGLPKTKTVLKANWYWYDLLTKSVNIFDNIHTVESFSKVPRNIHTIFRMNFFSHSYLTICWLLWTNTEFYINFFHKDFWKSWLLTNVPNTFLHSPSLHLIFVSDNFTLSVCLCVTKHAWRYPLDWWFVEDTCGKAGGADSSVVLWYLGAVFRIVWSAE